MLQAQTDVLQMYESDAEMNERKDEREAEMVVNSQRK